MAANGKMRLGYAFLWRPWQPKQNKGVARLERTRACGHGRSMPYGEGKRRPHWGGRYTDMDGGGCAKRNQVGRGEEGGCYVDSR
jgi:hypothetical protein